MADYPELIDDDLTINVHKLGGFPGLPFAIREGGGEADISATPIYFEIPSIAFRRALDPHPTNPRRRMLPKMTPAECAAVPADGALYVVWDESDATCKVDLISGRFERYE